MTDYASERAEVAAAVARIVAAGLVSGASGNVSRRVQASGGREAMAITASRVPYSGFTAGDVVVVDFDIDPLHGDGIPSSESLLHAAIYRARPDAGAVIHTHSIHASAFAVAGRTIPAIIDEQVVTLGGEIEVADYGASASQALADRAVRALGDRAAVLLRNHGAAVVGRDLEEAVAAAELLERTAHIYAVSLGLGEPPPLPADVVAAERAAYRMLRGLR